MPSLSHIDSPRERLARMTALGPRLAQVPWQKRLAWPMTLQLLAQAYDPDYSTPSYRHRATRWAAGLDSWS